MRRRKDQAPKRWTLGNLITSLRHANGWSLKQFSARVGIPPSTLSKVEAGKLSLNYEKLQMLTARLDLTMAEFLAGPSPEDSVACPPIITARRSVIGNNSTVRINAGLYDYDYLCTDLLKKRMVPILSRVRAKRMEEIGKLVLHKGEEFAYVLEGTVEVYLQFCTPVVVPAGKGIYIDGSMGHAYLAKNCDSALMIVVCLSEKPTLEDELMNLAGAEDSADNKP